MATRRLIGPIETIEHALVRIRRDQQAHRLRTTPDDLVTDDELEVDADRYRYLDSLDGATTGRSIAEVAERIGVDRPRASRLTADLIQDLLIERRPAKDDPHSVRVFLTPHGRAMVTRMHAHRRLAVAEALEGFTPDESRMLATLLDRFVENWPRDP